MTEEIKTLDSAIREKARNDLARKIKKAYSIDDKLSAVVSIKSILDVLKKHGCEKAVHASSLVEIIGKVVEKKLQPVFEEAELSRFVNDVYTCYENQKEEQNGALD